MAEFKKLSDVEVVAEPAESANVLIEEDGVIKKAPKTAVGGAGGGSDVLEIIVNMNSSCRPIGMIPIKKSTIMDAFKDGKTAEVRVICNVPDKDDDECSIDYVTPAFCAKVADIMYGERNLLTFDFILIAPSYSQALKIYRILTTPDDTEENFLFSEARQYTSFDA